MSEEAVTYSAEPPIQGRRFTCKRCKRVYAYPQDGRAPVRCECGWWYWNINGRIREEFRQRIDSPTSH
ncbi:MAG: hypothetical protein DLM50_01850 [Candidatus Meridianibacter frigidus]|nr:MAG: hypothetical protein DLM50_01850 [Candidatus Eremiobacteraeota bacterium]